MMPPSDEIERVEVEFRKDGILALFSTMVDRAPVPITLPLTLLVPAGVVTGELVSYTEYLRLLEPELVRVLGEGPGTDAINGMLADDRKTMVADMREEEAHGKPIDFWAVE